MTLAAALANGFAQGFCVARQMTVLEDCDCVTMADDDYSLITRQHSVDHHGPVCCSTRAIMKMSGGQEATLTVMAST